MRSLNYPYLVAAFLVINLMALAPSVHALDDKRNGFYLAFGGGGQATRLDFDSRLPIFTEERYVSGDGYGFALQLSIGGAFGNRFAIAGTHQITRYRVDGDEYHTFLLGVTGIHWFRSSRPSLYIATTLGRQSVRNDSFGGIFSGSATGNVFRFALGYEFANRLHLEGGLTIGEGSGIDNDGSSLDTLSTQIIASFVWY